MEAMNAAASWSTESENRVARHAVACREAESAPALESDDESQGKQPISGEEENQHMVMGEIEKVPEKNGTSEAQQQQEDSSGDEYSSSEEDEGGLNGHEAEPNRPLKTTAPAPAPAPSPAPAPNQPTEAAYVYNAETDPDLEAKHIILAVLTHGANCQERQRCPFPNCTESKSMVRHVSRCKHLQCTMSYCANSKFVLRHAQQIQSAIITVAKAHAAANNPGMLMRAAAAAAAANPSASSRRAAPKRHFSSTMPRWTPRKLTPIPEGENEDAESDDEEPVENIYTQANQGMSANTNTDYSSTGKIDFYTDDESDSSDEEEDAVGDRVSLVRNMDHLDQGRGDQDDITGTQKDQAGNSMRDDLNVPFFIPASTWQRPKPGYVFRTTEEKGTGYYLDQYERPVDINNQNKWDVEYSDDESSEDEEDPAAADSTEASGRQAGQCKNSKDVIISGSNLPCFIPVNTWQGSKPGYVFGTTKERGTGYHLDQYKKPTESNWDVAYSDDESTNEKQEPASPCNTGLKSQQAEQPTSAKDAPGSELDELESDEENAPPKTPPNMITAPPPFKKPDWNVEYSDDEDSEEGVEIESDRKEEEEEGSRKNEQQSTKDGSVDSSRWNIEYSDSDEESTSGYFTAESAISSDDEGSEADFADSNEVDRETLVSAIDDEDIIGQRKSNSGNIPAGIFLIAIQPSSQNIASTEPEGDDQLVRETLNLVNSDPEEEVDPVGGNNEGAPFLVETDAGASELRGGNVDRDDRLNDADKVHAEQESTTNPATSDKPQNLQILLKEDIVSGDPVVAAGDDRVNNGAEDTLLGDPVVAELKGQNRGIESNEESREEVENIAPSICTPAPIVREGPGTSLEEAPPSDQISGLDTLAAEAAEGKTPIFESTEKAKIESPEMPNTFFDSSMSSIAHGLDFTDTSSNERKVYHNVRYRNVTGVLDLSPEKIRFVSYDDQEPLSIIWGDIAKQQVSPAPHSFSKVVLYNGKWHAFQLNDRDVLEIVRVAIKAHLKTYRKSVDKAMATLKSTPIRVSNVPSSVPIEIDGTSIGDTKQLLHEEEKAICNKKNDEGETSGGKISTASVSDPERDTPSMYTPVKFKSQEGSLSVSNALISFTSSKAGSVSNTFPYSAIAKHQVNPQSHTKALLKLISPEGKAATFEIVNRAVLEKLKMEITRRRRDYKPKVASTVRSAEESNPSGVFKGDEGEGAITSPSSYGGVVFLNTVGTVQLSKEMLSFVASSPESNAMSRDILWKCVSKHQASPKIHSKALLKLILGSGKSLTMEVQSRTELTRLRKEVSSLLQEYQSTSARTDRSEKEVGNTSKQANIEAKT